jgi:hypothetical protein
MFRITTVTILATALLVLCGAGKETQGQEPRTGTIVGDLKSKKDSKDGKNVAAEVLAPGEEKARSYHVQYDQKANGPLPAVLKAVREAGVGDTVEFDWVATGHGPAITKFRVLKKSSGDKKKPASCGAVVTGP